MCNVIAVLCFISKCSILLYIDMSAWIYENGAEELKSRPKRGFFLARNVRYKNFRKVSPF